MAKNQPAPVEAEVRNLCGASEELQAVLSRLVDSKAKINRL